MSGTLAIAAVSAVLKYLLLNSQSAFNVSGTVNNLRISAVPPDLVGDDNPNINIFFYRATPNTGWSQRDLPSRDSRGERITNPFLALDLHYLITAHATQDFEGEVLLGYAMQVMHENPVLGRQAIRDALRPSTLTLPNPLVNAETTESLLAAFAAADLAEQFEQIKITPYNMSSEDASNLWSALQTRYRPTAAYIISVALIRSRRPSRAAPPVRNYNVYALPFRQPVITDVLAEDGPGTPIVTGKKLVLRGQSLRGDDTRVLLAGAEVGRRDAGAGMTVGDREISLNFPASARPGIQSVQVKHYLDIGTPPGPHRGFESNVAAFVLQPQIRRQADGEYMIVALAPTDTEPRRLRVTLDPSVGPAQRAEVLLNELNSPDTRPSRAYSFEASKREPDSAPTDRLDFVINGVAGGRYLVRVRVDGAESPVDFVEAQGYVTPAVNL
jgi:hypothetical protein